MKIRTMKFYVDESDPQDPVVVAHIDGEPLKDVEADPGDIVLMDLENWDARLYFPENLFGASLYRKNKMIGMRVKESVMSNVEFIGRMKQLNPAKGPYRVISKEPRVDDPPTVKIPAGP